MLDFKCAKCSAVHNVTEPKVTNTPLQVVCVCGHTTQVTKLCDDLAVFEIGTFYPPATPVYDVYC